MRKNNNKKIVKKNNILLLFLIAGLIVIIDQVTKYIIMIKLPLHGSINITPNFLNIVHIRNPGGAFGFMSENNPNIRCFLFVGISISAVIAIICFYLNTSINYKFFLTGLSLIIGGAIGNIIDRLKFGEVIDFIDFYIYSYHWPSFNIADSSIMIGISIFIFYSMLGKI